MDIYVTSAMKSHPDLDFHIQRMRDQLLEIGPLCLHEATHLVYARSLSFEAELYGPMIDLDVETQIIHVRLAAVQALANEILWAGDPLAVAKQIVGPTFVREKFFKDWGSEVPFDGMDWRNFDKWFDLRQRKRGDLGGLTHDAIRESVFADCGGSEFRKMLWDAAGEFEARVFGKPN